MIRADVLLIIVLAFVVTIVVMSERYIRQRSRLSTFVDCEFIGGPLDGQTRKLPAYSKSFTYTFNTTDSFDEVEDDESSTTYATKHLQHALYTAKGANVYQYVGLVEAEDIVKHLAE